MGFRFGKWRVRVEQASLVVLLMLVFTGAYAWESRALSREALLFPRFLYVCIAVTALLSLKHYVHVEKTEAAADMADRALPSRRLIQYIACTIFLLLCMQFLGAVITIPLFLAGAMWFLGVRGKRLLILVPLATDLFIYAVFRMWLAVPLPAGPLGI